MIVLAIDTTTDRLTLALGGAGPAPFERRLEGARRHAASLVPLLDELLAEASVEWPSVSRLAIANGPGGFPGLRVGAALAKALARVTTGLEVWTASTLLVRAAGVAPPGGGTVLVATTALRGELFAAVYRFGPALSVETIRSPGLATVETLSHLAPDLVIADAPERLADRLGLTFAVPLVRGSAALPRATALLALLDASGGAERISALDDWEPEYGRPAEAQARWEAAHGQRLPDPARHAR
jgi:tRNA threonylcarbamoyl adenosine modification protein YeaZ